MKVSLIIFFLTIVNVKGISQITTGQTKHRQFQKMKSRENAKLYYDTSKIAIIKYDNSVDNPFSYTYYQATLTQNDISLIDSLLDKCINEYNSSLKLTYDSIPNSQINAPIDTKNNIYKKQLLVVKNKKREKEVWVNCLCEIHDNSWKTKIIVIQDGGNCYFNFKINLTTKKYYDLIVNGTD